ncbi:MAG: serine/threonine protein kinase [Gemmataceae bacterium]|nr:serine/threonine protein kinase [Gemmataceae bacterium]
MIEPGKYLGPFVIEGELGSGAMGTVYKANYTETGQDVAIKIIGLGLAGNESALARFEREAEILKQLRHPNIVRLFATGRYKKTPFFAMEYVEGESLDKIMERRGRLPWEEVVHLGRQLCLALQHAHDKGIIHRDLKPSNLMILPDGTLKLTDFGIAKDTDVTALTGANSTVGTAAYMSPEQCKGERTLTSKSDLYSLGCVFYELLTGRKPFVKESPVDMFLAHVSEPVERPSRLVLDIPPWLDTLVCQLMEKKPEHRPFDAMMVKKVLDEVEDKMTSQRSAGLDMVKARVADRAGPGPADVTDREAARALRTGKKKKSKAKSAPVYEKTWFVASALVIGLGILATIGWWMTRPASPDVFFSRAQSALSSGSDSGIDIIRAYFAAYPDRNDDNARKMQGWLETLETDKLERQTHNRRNRKFTPDGESEKVAFAALNYEDEGKLDEAKRRWQELSDANASSAGDEAKTWSWLSKRKIKAIEDMPIIEKRWIDARTQPDFKPANDAERRAYTAVRYEVFGDAPAAHEAWAKTKSTFEKDLSNRNYVVMAAGKMRMLVGRIPEGADAIRNMRRDLLATRLSELNALAKQPTPFNVRQARALARDFSDLYGSDVDMELAPMVKQATATAGALPLEKEPK